MAKLVNQLFLKFYYYYFLSLEPDYFEILFKSYEFYFICVDMVSPGDAMNTSVRSL